MDTERKKKGHAVLLKFPISIVIIDHPDSGAPDSATLAKYAAAMTKSMLGDFAPIYNLTATWRYDTTAGQDEVICGMFSDPDQPGALGYHDLSLTGSPYIKVFPKLDAQDGANLSTTLDHEGKELTVDLTIDRSRMGKDGQFWADEPCDAVEQDEYTVDGVPLSNFVTPGWYSGIGGFDFLNKLTAPLTVDAGGYAQYFDPQQGWQQITHADKKPRPYRMNDWGRPHRRVNRPHRAA